MNKMTKKIISVVIMLVFAAGVVLAGMSIRVTPAKVEAVNIEGMNAETYQVTALEKMEDGYYVYAHGTGYNDSVDIELKIAFDTTGQKILGVEVLNQAETDGLGSKITEADYILQYTGAEAPFSVAGLIPVNPAAPQEEESTEPAGDVIIYVDGTYTAEAAEFHNGYKDIVTVVIEGGKIVSVDYNCLTEDGGTKREQSENGEYVMTEDGPLWHEQADSFAQYVVDNQGTAGLNLNDSGKTDVIAGVSIGISGAEALVNECLTQALTGPVATVAYTDGTYTAEAAEFHNGYKDIVTVVISGGKIASVEYDCLTEDGGTKSAQSEAGEYVMTEDGPLWHEQAEALAAYVVENQSTAGILNDSGKTDVIAGVSITVSGATGLIDECLAKAAAGEASMNDGTYTAEAAEFHNGYKDIVTIVVEGGKIVSADYNCLTEDGGTKREQSENGEYVMTEDGPLWHEQADSLAAYVVEHQGTDGLNLDESGKTDVVAGVSIGISGAEALFNECIAQAAAPKATMADGTYTAEAAEFHNGYKDIVTIVVEGGKIVSADYNCLTEDGGTKREQSENGEYVMTEDGPLWHEQADSLAAYVVEHQGTDGLNLNESGKTDVVAGVSIGISGAETLFNECIAQAEAAAQKPAMADGTYTAEAAEFSNGYKEAVTIVVEGGKIVSVDYNPLVEGGGTKREQSESGEYVMTEDGLLWHEQADNLAQYVIEHQGTAGLLNESGKTDVVAGVSIYVGGAEALISDCIAQAEAAAGNTPVEDTEEPVESTPVEEEAPAIDATLIDGISGATVSSKAVAKIINNAYYFLQDNIVK